VQPDVIFFVFLPPLLYWASINTSYREFRHNGREIVLLAVGLVVVTATAVAAVAHAILPMLSWPAAFALGAAVGPTDAVAATAVMRRFGVPLSVLSVLEGESLVNDATSLVIFQMAIAASNTGQFSLGPATLRFLWAAGGGVLLGLAAGWCIAQLRRWLGSRPDRSAVVESSLSLLTPYVAFAAADRVRVSGVLAVVAVGLYLGHHSARLLSASARRQVINMWEVLDFLLEGVLFILVGLGLPLALGAVGTPGGLTTAELVRATVLVCAVVITLRLAWVFPAAYGPPYFRVRYLGKRDTYPPWRSVFFEGWAGLRGAVSLVLALSIPFATANGAPFPGRDVVIFLTFAVILVTLVGQGLTLGPLIRWLALEPDQIEAREEAEARLRTARVGLQQLDDIASGKRASDHTEIGTDVSDDADLRQAAEQLHGQYIHRVHYYRNLVHRDPEDGDTRTPDDRERDDREAESDVRSSSAYQRLRLAMIKAERKELVRLRDTGRISDGTLHRIELDLDLEQMLLAGQDD